MRHGGDLAWASRSYGIAEGDWLDLSTGINPRLWPGAAAMETSELKLDRLPAADEMEELLNSARSFHGVPSEVAIAATPGSEAIIRCLPRLIPGAASLVATSYGSYAEAWRQAERPLRPVEAAAAVAQDPETSLVLVNPNNPDGRTVRPGEILLMARNRQGGALLVVDEAFADAEDGVSVVPCLRASDPVLVLKSFGKFFGLPGLRLGFAIGPETVVNPLAAGFGDWPVSSAALAIGSRALADLAWQRETRRWLPGQAAQLDDVLRSAGLTIVGGTPLFRLARHADAAGLHSLLARQAIWTRIWPEPADLIRFGLPPDETGLIRLSEALGEAVRR